MCSIAFSDSMLRCAATEQGRDPVTGLRWCLARMEGLAAWSVGADEASATRGALARLTAGLRCVSAMPGGSLLGLGWGGTRAAALAAAWQDLFLCAVSAKLRRGQVVPPEAVVMEPAVWAELRDRYRAAGMTVSLKDCGMLKGYPVLALWADGALVPGTGATWREATLDCVARDVRRRTLGAPPGIAMKENTAPSCPAAPQFHGSAGEALGGYLAMARRYGAEVRARDLSADGLFVYQVYLEKPDPGLCAESDLDWRAAGSAREGSGKWDADHRAAGCPRHTGGCGTSTEAARFKDRGDG